MPSSKIVVIGNTYSSAAVFSHLESCLNQTREPIDLLLISQKNYYVLNSLIPQFMAGSCGVYGLTEFNRELKYLRPGVSYLESEIININFENKTILTSKGEVEYKYLVLAPENDKCEYSFNSDEKNIFTVKDLFDVICLKKHIISLLEEASKESDSEKKKKMLSFYLLGSKDKDIELAFSLSDFLRGLLRTQFTEVKKSFISIEVIEEKSTVDALREPYFNSYLFYNLTKKGIKVHTNMKISEFNKGSIKSGSKEFFGSTFIATPKFSYSSLLKDFNIDKDDKLKAYVDLYLRAQGKENVFIVGPTSKCLDINEGYEKSDLYLKEEASLCSANILSSINSNPLKPLKTNFEINFLSIGTRNAIVEVKNFCFYGLLPWLLYRMLYIWYFINWKKKLRACISLFLGIIALKDREFIDLFPGKMDFEKIKKETVEI